jgi:hypothetical protein
MSLTRIVSVSIVASAPPPTAPGFGVPLILGYHTKFAELVRYYTGTAGMVTDGFAVTDPEYLAAAAIMSQNPSVPRFAVGRRTNIPTQVVELTPTATNAAIYHVTINGVTFNYTADSSATVKEIIDGLVTAIGSPTGVTPSNHSDTTLRLTGTAGTWFSWAVSDNSGNANGMGLWSVKDITAHSSVEADLTACAAADSGWYAFVVTHQNAQDGAYQAVWAEANNKLHIINLADTDIKITGSSDLASVVKAAGQQQTAVCYHQKQSEFLSAAWLGNCLPFDPGSETWAFKTLASITADVLTESEVGYIDGKYGNWYTSEGGRNITQRGTTGKPQFIDTVRFLAWLQANIQYDEYGVLVSLPKVPYTDAGVGLLENALRARLQKGVDVGGLASFTVTAPLVSTETTADRGNRILPDMKFAAVVAGAIQELHIQGTISF